MEIFSNTKCFSFDKVINNSDKRGQKRRIRKQLEIKKGDDYSGVYILTYKRKKPFPRLVHKDRRGIIYMGQSQKLVDRIHQLINDMISKEENLDKYHSGGLTYRLFYKDKGPISKVEKHSKKFVIYCRRSNSPLKEEAKLFAEYIKRFYDKPILNISLSRKEIRNIKEKL